ncbi:sigma 54-interacting transcriptional regulator [Pedobacter miscanthi]|nr:sigma 54-interacting transcriptional regulator [Pedobacter miscanthi]
MEKPPKESATHQPVSKNPGLSQKGEAITPQISESSNEIESLKRERDIILTLSNDITKVRNKTDLINVFSSRIKKLFYFSHITITLIDEKREHYYPFLLDPSGIIQDHPSYKKLSVANFNLHEPYIQSVLNSDEPVSFLLDEIIDDPKIPPYMNINYDGGIREILVTPLTTKEETIGFINIYAIQAGKFTNQLRQVMIGISPLLANIVAHIITNEQIEQREFTNKVLLSLSNDLATSRNRKEVVKVLNNGLRKLFEFSHSLITVSDDERKTYSAFALDTESRSEEKSKYIKAIAEPNSIEDGIYNVASHSYHAVVFDMKAQDLRKTPLWFRLNYAVGSREMLIKMLPNADLKKFALVLFADETGTFDDRVVEIIERISSPLSGIVRNISSNENIQKKEKEKAFLLDFAEDIAAVRKKDDLEASISSVLDRMLGIRLSMIRVIDDAGELLEPYMYDERMFGNGNEEFKKQASQKIPVSEVLSARVLQQKEPVIFNIVEEEAKGNNSPYIKFWKNAGFSNAFGAALRVGNKNFGTLWLMIDDINMTLLKGLCAQISIAISNILANEKIWNYKQKLEIENTHLHEQIRGLYNFSEIIGEGAAMQNVYHMMSAVSDSATTVLIHGETGTGKELIARAVHNASPRNKKIMIKINCAALPPHLIESELFGHEKGAFTGAYEKRIGKFELAHGGTLFLDEIGELPLELQVKMLRVLQEREFERIGGKETLKVDVRIIAATNRNLAVEVGAGKFRSDLFYRLNVFPITLPPLRDRREDVEPLTRFFITRYSKKTGIGVNSISPKALSDLENYSWPGNIRELEHLIERSILLSSSSTIQSVHLPKVIPEDAIGHEVYMGQTLEEIERFHIIEMLKSCKGKISGPTGAAEVLGIPPSTLHSKMKKLGITRADYFPV